MASVKAPAKKIGFVVMRVGWEFNDECYYRPDSEGGRPVKVFDNARHAHAYCKALNDKEIAEDRANKYGPMTDRDDKPITKYFEVVEAEIE